MKLRRATGKFQVTSAKVALTWIQPAINAVLWETYPLTSLSAPYLWWVSFARSVTTVGLWSRQFCYCFRFLTLETWRRRQKNLCNMWQACGVVMAREEPQLPDIRHSSTRQDRFRTTRTMTRKTSAKLKLPRKAPLTTTATRKTKQQPTALNTSLSALTVVQKNEKKYQSWRSLVNESDYVFCSLD